MLVGVCAVACLIETISRLDVKTSWALHPWGGAWFAYKRLLHVVEARQAKTIRSVFRASCRVAVGHAHFAAWLVSDTRFEEARLAYQTWALEAS